MQIKFCRYRWLFLIACLAPAVGVIGWLQPLAQPAGRFSREQYDRIRLGMTVGEVASVMGCPGANGDLLRTDGLWETAACDAPPSTTAIDVAQMWLDEFVIIRVCYRDGKAIKKDIQISAPTWKTKAREWLDWLRGLVAR